MQHFAPYAAGTAACGADMTGRRNSALDGNSAATTCERCITVLDGISAREAAEDRASYAGQDA